jgi:hypothetical protein
MPRHNNSKRSIRQRSKIHFEDKVARRAVKRAVEAADRDLSSKIYYPDGRVGIVFTDPSYLT